MSGASGDTGYRMSERRTVRGGTERTSKQQGRRERRRTRRIHETIDKTKDETIAENRMRRQERRAGASKQARDETNGRDARTRRGDETGSTPSGRN